MLQFFHTRFASILIQTLSSRAPVLTKKGGCVTWMPQAIMHATSMLHGKHVAGYLAWHSPVAEIAPCHFLSLLLFPVLSAAWYPPSLAPERLGSTNYWLHKACIFTHPPVSIIRLSPLDPWRWDHYVISKWCKLITLWHSIISQETLATALQKPKNLEYI
jgi:hypothetical protein